MFLRYIDNQIKEKSETKNFVWFGTHHWVLPPKKLKHMMVYLNTSVLYSTCGRAIGLTLVTGWRNGWHHQVEGYGNIQSSQVPRSRPNHSNLVVSLKVHVWWTSSLKETQITRLIVCPLESFHRMLNMYRINTSITAVIGRSRDEGFAGIIHRSTHKATPLTKTRNNFIQLDRLRTAHT